MFSTVLIYIYSIESNVTGIRHKMSVVLTLEHSAQFHVSPDDLSDAVDVRLPAAVDVGVVDVIPAGRLDRN